MSADADYVGDGLLRETTTNPKRTTIRRGWQIFENTQLSADFFRD